MGCIALVRCVLVLRCGLAGVVWCGIRMQPEALHHFDSSIKRDQLDVTCFIISLFNALHVSDVNTSIHGIILLKLTFIYRQFNTQQFYVLPTQCICVFCVDLRTNSDYFTLLH